MSAENADQTRTRWLRIAEETRDQYRAERDKARATLSRIRSWAEVRANRTDGGLPADADIHYGRQVLALLDPDQEQPELRSGLREVRNSLWDEVHRAGGPRKSELVKIGRRFDAAAESVQVEQPEGMQSRPASEAVVDGLIEACRELRAENAALKARFQPPLSTPPEEPK